MIFLRALNNLGYYPNIKKNLSGTNSHIIIHRNIFTKNRNKISIQLSPLVFNIELEL